MGPLLALPTAVCRAADPKILFASSLCSKRSARGASRTPAGSMSTSAYSAARMPGGTSPTPRRAVHARFRSRQARPRGHGRLLPNLIRKGQEDEMVMTVSAPHGRGPREGGKPPIGNLKSVGVASLRGDSDSFGMGDNNHRNTHSGRAELNASMNRTGPKFTQGHFPASPPKRAGRRVWRIIRLVWIFAGVAFTRWLYDSLRAKGVEETTLQSNA